MSIGIFQGLENNDVVLDSQEQVLSSTLKTVDLANCVFQSISSLSTENIALPRKIYPITKTGFPNLFFAESKEAQEKLISNLENAITNILPKIRIPYLSKDKTFKFTGFFAEIETLIRKQDPQAVVYLGGGSIRSILSFIYKELYEAYNNGQDPQLLLSQICQGTAKFSVQREDGMISSLDVLGVESDLDIYVQFSANCLNQQQTLNNAKKFINEGLQALSNSPYKALLCPPADIKEYQPQLQRASRNGGSPIDWLVFPLTSVSGSSFKVPEVCPNVLENFCSGILAYKPVENAENPCITTLRMYRSLFELPFLELDEEDNLRFIKDLQAVSSQNMDYTTQKVQQVFEKILRNTRFSDRLNFEIKNEATDSCILERQKILTNISQKFKLNNTLPALPELLPSNFRVKELDLETIKLLNDKNLFITAQQFIDQYTANGILYHGTPELRNVIPMIRGNLVVSTENQGRAAFGRGFYSTKHRDIAEGYAGAGGQVLHFQVNQDGLTVVDLNVFPRDVIDLLVKKSSEKKLDFNEYLAKYLKIDIIINNHILVQNTRCISLKATQENFFNDAIFKKTKDSIQFFENFKREYANQYSDFELLEKLKNFSLASVLLQTISKEEFEKLEPSMLNGWKNANELAVLLVKKKFSFLENLLAYPEVQALMNEKAFVLNAIKQHPSILKYASDQLKNDKEVVLAAVNKNGLVLEYASDQLRDDKEVVLMAIKDYGWAIEYASDRLKDDEEIVLEVVIHQDFMDDDGKFALRFASSRLKQKLLKLLISELLIGKTFVIPDSLFFTLTEDQRAEPTLNFLVENGNRLTVQEITDSLIEREINLSLDTVEQLLEIIDILE